MGAASPLTAGLFLSAPVSCRLCVDRPPHHLPSTCPFVWLPTFMVQGALLGHVLVVRALRSAPIRRAVRRRRPDL